MHTRVFAFISSVLHSSHSLVYNLLLLTLLALFLPCDQCSRGNNFCSLCFCCGDYCYCKTWLLSKTIFVMHAFFCYFCFNFSGLHGSFLWFHIFFALFGMTRCKYKFGHTCSSIYFLFFTVFSHIKVSEINRFSNVTLIHQNGRVNFSFFMFGGPVEKIKETNTKYL